MCYVCGNLLTESTGDDVLYSSPDLTLGHL